MRRVLVACLLSLPVASAAPASAQTQTGVSQWQFESVTPAPATCPAGLNLVGFDHDLTGRPVLAWQQDCTNAGAPPRVFWGRKDLTGWSLHEYVSDRRYQGGGDGDVGHALILMPGDGAPFLIFTAPGPSNELNTYSINLDASLGGAASVYLENLVGPQSGVTATYAPAAERFATATGGGQLATGFYLSNDLGSVRINGATISTAPVYRPRVSYAVAPDGGQHLLWSTGTTLYYTSRAPRAPTYQTRVLNSNLERFGGEVKLSVDASGVLHALVRGYDPDSASDSGTLVYFSSADNGATWSPPEHVDPFDAIAANPGVHANVALALDAAGVPSVTYWKSQQQLIYARRDGPGGTWTRSIVATRPNTTASRAAFLDVDAADNPVVAFFDQPSNRLLLARPVAQGVTVPVDLAVSGVVAPAAVAAGGPLTYTLTVTNQGTTTVSNVTLDLRVPPGVTLGTATPATATSGTWTFASVPPYTSTTVVVTATAPLAEGDVVATATVSSRATDADPADDGVVLQAAVRNQACFVATAGLAGLFRGDRNADNDIATEADGVVKGSVSYTPAAVGDGFLFNGTNGVVSVQATNENAFYPGTGSFTVQAFVRTTATQAQVVASRYECVSPYCGLTTWFLQITNGVPNVFVRDLNGNTVTFGGTRAINDGALHHIGFVVDRAAAALRLYIDGVRDASQVLTLGDVSHNVPVSTPLLIGAFQQTDGTLSRFFDGVIDELAIARRAYSDAEMAQIAAIPSGAGCAVLPPPGTDADIAPAISVTPIDVEASGAIEYVLRATNLGAGTASTVSLSHELPAGGALVSAVPPGQPTGPGTSTYAVGPLAGGASAWVVVRATAPPTPGPATSTVTSASISDGNPANDTASAAVVVTRGACILVPVGLLAGWPANGTMADVVGSHAGALHGTTDFTQGRVSAGLALRLDGSGFVEVPDAPALRPTQFTLGAWVSPEFQAPGVPLTILSKGSSGTDTQLPAGAFTWWLGAVDGLATFSVSQGAATVTLQGRTDISSDWHHVAASYDGTTVRLYVDGVEEDTRALTLPLHYDTGTAPLLIGDLAGSSGSQRFYGLIDDVTLHGRALTPAEIQSLVDGPSASCLANTSPTLTPPADRVNDEGDSAVLQIQAFDANADTLTFVASNLPPGLSIDPTYGLINGTVTTRGVYSVTVLVTDGIGLAQAAFTWTVQGNSPPVLTAGFPPADREGDTVSRALKTLVNASDPDSDPLTFTVSGLPPGLGFSNATGLVTGTIPYGTAGTYPVVITADDGAGGTAAITLTWTVEPQIPLLIDVVETVAVVDVTAVQPSVFIEVTEAVEVADTVQVAPALFIALVEQVSVDDQVVATPAAVIEIVERVAVADAVIVQPSVVIAVDEAVRVSDTPAVLPAVLIVVPEVVSVADQPGVLPSVVITVAETVRVAESSAAVPARLIDISESIVVTDRPRAVAVPLNRPPVVRVRPWTVAAGASCSARVAPQFLNNGSFDPEGGPLSFALVPPGPFPLGTSRVQLVVTDQGGLSSSARTTLTVRDLTPPAATANLAIQMNRVLFVVQFGATDNCDPAPAVTAVMAGPPLQAPPLTIVDRPGARTVQLRYMVNTRRVIGYGPRLQVQAAAAAMAALGGAPVTNGQTVTLQRTAPTVPVYEYEFQGTTLRTVSGPALTLRVTARDAAGNVVTATASPP